MATIGSIVVNLTAETAAFVSQIDAGGKAVEGLGKHAESASGLLSSFTEGLGIGTGIEVVKGGFDIAEKAAETFIDTGKEVVTTLAEWSAQALETAEQAATLSSTIGIGTETFQGLSKEGKHFGLETADVETALLKFTKSMGQFAAKGQESSATLEHFGINFKDLASKSPDDALRTVADALAAIDNKADRAYIATELFGKSGAKLLPLFSEGAKGIDEAIAKGLKFGDVLHQADTAKLVAAKEATDDVGRAFDGVKNAVAVGAAPVIKAFADRITELSPSSAKMQAGFIVAFDTVIELGAEAVDTVAHLAGWFLQGAADVQFLEASLLKAMGDGHGAAEAREIGYQLQSWAKSADALNTSKGVHDFINGMHKDIDDAGKHIEDRMKEAGKAGADGFLENMQKVSDTLAGLKKDVDEFGMTSGQKKLFELKQDGASPAQLSQARGYEYQLEQLETHKKVLDEIKHLQEQIAGKSGDSFTAKATELIAAGASPKEIQHLKELNDQLTAVEEHQKNLEKAKELWKESETPLQKYQDKLAEINKLLADHALTQEQAAQARAKALQELGKAEGEGMNHAAALVERRFDFRLPSQARNDPKTEALTIQKQQFQIQQEEHQWNRDNWQALSNPPAPIVLDIPA